MNKEPLNVALYARVSTGRQENEQTIDSQLEEVKAKIKEDENTLLPENVFIDDGWSGEMIVRPALDQMRDAARENKFEALYVYDRGRLSRTFYHQELIIDELNDRDIRFISLHDVAADTPEARVMQSMQGVFHEYERIKIAERMRRGKLYKAKNGTIINGTPLYGYRYIKDQQTGEVRCEINEDEAKVVQLIWQWFAVDRISINQVVRKLYDLGIKPRKRKSDFWTKGPVIRILKCETYVTGKAYYNKSEAVVSKHPLKDRKYKKVKKTSRKVRDREDWIAFDVPVLIKDRNLYEKAQSILDFNQKYASKRRKYDYLLSGLIYCGCGNRRSGDGSSKYGHYYYRCIDRIRNKPFERKCNACGINAVILDGLIWNELNKKLFNRTLLKKYAEKWIKSMSIVSSEEKLENQKLSQKIHDIAEEENRYSKAYGTGTLEFEQYQMLMKEAKKRKSSYSKQLANIANKSAEIAIHLDTEELVEEALKVIKSLDFSDKFKIIRDIIDKVVVTERSGAEIWAHIPLPVQITEKLGYELERRDSGVAKCGEEYAF